MLYIHIYVAHIYPSLKRNEILMIYTEPRLNHENMLIMEENRFNKNRQMIAIPFVVMPRIVKFS